MSQESTGTLSYAAICTPQESHIERPPTTELPRGIRWATTPTKLPVMIPPTKASEAMGNMVVLSAPASGAFSGGYPSVSRCTCQADCTGSKKCGGSW